MIQNWMKLVLCTVVFLFPTFQEENPNKTFRGKNLLTFSSERNTSDYWTSPISTVVECRSTEKGVEAKSLSKMEKEKATPIVELSFDFTNQNGGLIQGTLRIGGEKFKVECVSLDQPIQIYKEPKILIGETKLSKITGKEKQTNFPKLATSIRETARMIGEQTENFKNWNSSSFSDQVKKLGDTATDDFEFWYFCNLIGRKELGVTHQILQKFQKLNSLDNPDGIDFNIEGELAILKISSHSFYIARNRGEIPKDRELFWLEGTVAKLVQPQVKTLIIDVRNNDIKSGILGSFILAGHIATHLYTKKLPLGVFYPQQEQAKVLKMNLSELPVSNHYDIILGMRNPTPADEMWCIFGTQLAGDPIKRIDLSPREPVFTGNVAVLVNRHTEGDAEILADLLQRTKRARIFGENTVGSSMRSGLQQVDPEWVLVIAASNYINADGKSFEFSGIQPDEKTTDENALAAAIKYLKTMPASPSK